LFMLLIPAQHCSLPETIHHKKMNIPHPISLSRRAGSPTLPYRGLYKCLSHPTYSVHCFPHLIFSLCDLSIIYSPSCCISVLELSRVKCDTHIDMHLKDGICQKDFRLFSTFMIFNRRGDQDNILSLRKWQHWSAGFARPFSTWISRWESTVWDLLSLVYKLKDFKACLTLEPVHSMTLDQYDVKACF
jgi:hypothetical protein